MIHIFQFIKTIIVFLFTSRVLPTYFTYYRRWRRIVKQEQQTLVQRGFQIDWLYRLGLIIQIPQDRLSDLEFLPVQKHDITIEQFRLEAIADKLSPNNEYFLMNGLRELLHSEYIIEKSEFQKYTYYLILHSKVVAATVFEIWLKIILVIGGIVFCGMYF